MYACVCRAISQSDVKRAGRAGHIHPDALIAVLRLDDEDSCGRCLTVIDEFVDLACQGAAEANLGSPADFAPEPAVRYALPGTRVPA
jgi:bacterioferritin-associated ferredoxin